MITYANRKRLKKLILKKGNKVYLFYKNIKTKWPNNKLDYKKLSLFKIEKKLLDTNFRLLLPRKIRIYLIFYILFLKLAPANIWLEI
jgi:hypothetical protein